MFPPLAVASIADIWMQRVFTNNKNISPDKQNSITYYNKVFGYLFVVITISYS